MSLGVYLILTSTQINSIPIKAIWRAVYLGEHINHQSILSLPTPAISL